GASGDEMASCVAISDLLDAYAEAVDDKDWDVLGALFTPDAVLDYTRAGGPRGTFEEVLPFLQQGLGLFSVTQHFITNRRIKVDGDRAESSAYLYNPLGRDDGGGMTFLAVGGRYVTRYRRTPDGWRISEHAVFTLWGPRPM
ncbi:MAG TPA: nuclear transport factor 2 family protein, partial [Actinomycetota bacterium]